eukprot:617689-Rhodomonas_salina.1
MGSRVCVSAVNSVTVLVRNRTLAVSRQTRTVKQCGIAHQTQCSSIGVGSVHPAPRTRCRATAETPSRGPVTSGPRV